MHQLTFMKKQKIAKDTYTFCFMRPEKDFHFSPGQYLSLIINNGAHTLSHDFSIASSPHEKKFILITTKKGTSEFKEMLFNLQCGNQIQSSKPAGGFILDGHDSVPTVFLAGGIGIVPFFSMIQYTLQKKMQTPITLLASFGTKEEMMYSTELLLIAKKHPHIVVVYTLTKVDKLWRGETGRISEVLVKKYVGNLTLPIYYVAGSPDFVVNMEEMLEKAGVNINNIRTEQFTGY